MDKYSRGDVVVVASDSDELATALAAHFDREVRSVGPSSLAAALDGAACAVVDVDLLDGSVRERLDDRRVPTVVRSDDPDLPTSVSGVVPRTGDRARCDLVERIRRTLRGGGETPDDRIAALHRAATDVVGAQTEEELYRLTLSAAEGVLAFDVSYLSMVDDDQFVTVALSPQREEYDFQSIPLDHGVTGETHRSGESFLVDDLEADDLAEPVHGIRGAAVSVPVGEYGVLQAVSAEKGTYTEADLELAELLAAYAAETLGRIRSQRRLRERERELERQTERLDRFASVVSHDLRNPLNVAQGSIQLARETGEPDHLDDAETATDRMERLVDDLLSLARKGEVVGDTGAVDVEAVVRDAWAGVDTGDAVLAVEDLDPIEADADRLRDLLANLFRNAVEHSSTSPDSQARQDAVEHSSTSFESREREHDGAPVRVEVGPLADGGGFYVADDGSGVSAEERDRLFEWGYTTADDGTGFGLAIVAEIAEAHGWAVEVGESAAGGARFEVSTQSSSASDASSASS